MSTNLSQSILLLGGFLLFSSAQATQITIVNKDAAGVGLNDSTVVVALPSNPGTTMGDQAMNVFQAAADYWETRINSSVELKVNMNFAQLACTQNGAVLGSAGASGYTGNFLNRPVVNTFFSRALARSYIGIGGAYPAGKDSDINARFNGGIGQPGCLQALNWSYQISDQISPNGTSSLYRVAIHEIGHGLGFATLVDVAGRNNNPPTGQKANGFNDIYMTFLKDATTNKNWADMSDAERLTSSVNTNNLIWVGGKAVAEATPLLTAGKNGVNPSMYAPNPVEKGSSVSHWNTTHVPDSLMEPSETPTMNDQLTAQALYDMHWVDPCRITKTLVANEWTQISLPCVAPSTANTVSDILADDMTTGTYGIDWVVYGYNPSTNAYSDLGLTGVMESGKGYWVIHTSQAAVLDMPHNSVGNSSSKSTQCASGNDCFEIDLATQSGTNQWQMIGVPYRDSIQVADLRLKKDTGTSTCNDSDGCTFTESAQNTLADNTLWSYNGVAYVDLLLSTEINPWTGAWLSTLSGANGSSPKLFLPKKEAIPSG